MTKHEIRTFTENAVSDSLGLFPTENRFDAKGYHRPHEPRAGNFVVFAVLAFVFGLLAVLTFAAEQNAPQTVVTDKTLMTMYGP
jgi:hypothetical protein